MKHIQQWLSSSALLLLGFAVVGFSLQVSHVRASYASTGDIERPVGQSAGSDLRLLVQADMPGSAPYLVKRGWERMAMLWVTDDDKPKVWVGRIHDRIESAELAWKSEQRDVAFSTYLKAFGYLHQVAHVCFAQETQEELCSREETAGAANSLLHSLRQYPGTASDDHLRARVEGLSSQVQTLQNQFHF